jgi:hypothetical protein
MFLLGPTVILIIKFDEQILHRMSHNAFKDVN